MQREQVWLAASFSWSESGLEDSEYRNYAKSIGALPGESRAVAFVVFWEVCGAFAVFTVGALLSMGAALPDWGFKDEYVLHKVSAWRNRSLVLSLINPLWVVGYPLACVMAFGGWLKLNRNMRKQWAMAQPGAPADRPSSASLRRDGG